MERDIDGMIIRELQRNAKQTMGQLSRRTGIPPTTVHNRIKRMEKEGIIRSYAPVLDHAKLGKGIHALIFISAEHKADQHQLAKRLLAMDHIESARIITGGFDIIAEVRVASVEELNRTIISDLRKVPGIEKTQTMIVLDEMD